MLSALLVGAGSIAVGLLFVLDYEAPCRRTGPVADLDLSYHMPQPYAAASVLMNLVAPTLLVLPVALLWLGRRVPRSPSSPGSSSASPSGTSPTRSSGTT